MSVWRDNSASQDEHISGSHGSKMTPGSCFCIYYISFPSTKPAYVTIYIPLCSNFFSKSKFVLKVRGMRTEKHAARAYVSTDSCHATYVQDERRILRTYAAYIGRMCRKTSPNINATHTTYVWNVRGIRNTGQTHTTYIWLCSKHTCAIQNTK